jgi:hypothetical protein
MPDGTTTYKLEVNAMDTTADITKKIAQLSAPFCSVASKNNVLQIDTTKVFGKK